MFDYYKHFCLLFHYYINFLMYTVDYIRKELRMTALDLLIIDVIH